MDIVEEWDSSFGGRLVALLLTSIIVATPFAFASSVSLAEPDPALRTTTTSATDTTSPAAPRTSSTTAATKPTSCDIVIIEAIFEDGRIEEVRDKGHRLDLEVEFYEQSSRVTVAFIRFDSDDEQERIFGIVRVNGWSDSYVSELDQDDCELGP